MKLRNGWTSCGGQAARPPLQAPDERLGLQSQQHEEGNPDDDADQKEQPDRPDRSESVRVGAARRGSRKKSRLTAKSPTTAVVS